MPEKIELAFDLEGAKVLDDESRKDRFPSPRGSFKPQNLGTPCRTVQVLLKYNIIEYPCTRSRHSPIDEVLQVILRSFIRGQERLHCHDFAVFIGIVLLQDYLMISLGTKPGPKCYDIPVDLNWPTKDLITSLTLL